MSTDLVGRCHAGFSDIFFGRVNDVVHLVVDKAADDEIVPALISQVAMFRTDAPGGIPPKVDITFKLLLGEQSGVQPVVDVVAVVGDLVGEIGPLASSEGW